MSQETERYQLENNGNTYLVRTPAGSGGGADVVANPEGTATTDLEKLKVGETIYGIPVGYDVHTYQANKIYSSADTDYEQLRYDVSHFLPIRIGNGIYNVERIVTGTSPEYVYTAVLPDNNFSTTKVVVQRVSITLGVSNVIITSLTTINLGVVQDGSPSFDGTSSTGLVIAGVRYPFVAKETRYLTTAPTADNTSGYLQTVVLTSEPATYYNGYYYIIAPST